MTDIYLGKAAQKKMTLKEITKDLLLYENVSTSEINNAIDSHNWVVINYDGTDNTHTDKRMIQPVAYGMSTAGNAVIRAFENFGDTKTVVPRWKYFRIDRISSWRNTGKVFDEPQPLFNPHGDKTMAIVNNIAKFGDEQLQTPVSSPKKKSDEIYHTDTEKGLTKLRKQLENPITLSDFKTQNGVGNIDLAKQKAGPKTKQDAAGGTDSVKTNDYNYNVFDDSLSVAGKNAKRNGHYYYQNRNKGKFAKGFVYDNPQTNDEDEIEAYLNSDHGNNRDLKDIAGMIGDTSKPITLQDLKNRLRKQ